MPEIKIIQNTTIPRINPIKIPVEQSIPDTQHVTKTLPPTLTMPCVTLRNDGTQNNQLFIDDPVNNKQFVLYLIMCHYNTMLKKFS